MPKRSTNKTKDVDTLIHDEARRVNIPSAEFESVMRDEEKRPIHIAYERRNRDLDPQLVWRGKDEQDWSDLIVQAPPLYIQEKVHPKVLIDDLMRESKAREGEDDQSDTMDLFADFNGLPKDAQSAEFYQHDANWTNRMILGDSLQVMASLAEREGLRGKVQCIYLDPPYGIKFNSNFQWSTTGGASRDGQVERITREPEMVKAFRDTWRDGIHSYLTYLRDRLTVARDLLAESGSVFVQIGDENVHRVRALMDEIFGEQNFISLIAYNKTSGFSGNFLSNVSDYIVWYSKNSSSAKYRNLGRNKVPGEAGATKYRALDTYKALANSPLDRTLLVDLGDATSQDEPGTDDSFFFRGEMRPSPKGLHWKSHPKGMERVSAAGRLVPMGKSIRYVRSTADFDFVAASNIWSDIGGIQSRSDPKVYVVQTATEAVKRCILMATDPGDLVLDPTCGSGTTAFVAEQWGRRWITIDTSRVALALARARVMGARYPWYLLADSPEGLQKEAEITRTPPKERTTHGDIRQGFVYERVPHITLKSIANNAEIDVIWERFQEELEPLRHELNAALGRNGERKSPAEAGKNGPWEEWEIPREADDDWSDNVKGIHAAWWEKRIARQKEIDASIAAKADYEYLYDKPYTDNSKVRVAGPFTVESLSPHRVLTVDEDDQLVDGFAEPSEGYRHEGDAPERDFAAMILENLEAAGVQQADKSGKIDFTSLKGWPGEYICAEGTYQEGDVTRRAGIFIGPEFGTVSRPDLVAAAREAGDAGFDVLIACAFNYDAHSAEFEKLGRVPVLKARMNADLHMADDLKNTGKGNLFVIFGEPDIEIDEAGDDQITVKINGVDVFHPQTGEIESSGPEGIACWFIDTDYNEESFFVRHAYFLGANDPYKALKTTLKAEIDEEAWETLHSDISRPFTKPSTGRIAVKVINHLGDEVMKVFSVG